MLYQFARTLSSVAQRLPRKILRAVGTAIGEVGWLLVPPRRKKLAVDNIMRSLALTEEAARPIARRSATRFGRLFMELLALPSLTRERINRFVTMDGEENLVAALAHGHGALLATAHAGNWELAAAVLSLNGYPLVAVAQKQTNEAMDRFINHCRTSVGTHITYKSGVRDMIRFLGQGKCIGLLIDQDAKEQGVFVDFFGRPAATARGAATLARMKNSPVVPIYARENPDGTHTLILRPAVWVSKTDDAEEDIRQATQTLTTILENHIRAWPDQWFWLHNRWKTRPPAER